MNAQRTDRILAPGDRLPDLSLASAPDGAAIALRTRRRLGTVVVLLHAADCDRCVAYLMALADHHDSLVEWDGRVLPVVPEELAAAARLQREARLPFPVLADPEGEAAARGGIPGAVVLIADQWGELFLVADAGPEHHFPSATEVADWLRFLAVRCPECEGEAL